VTRDIRYACPTMHVGLSFCNLATLASSYGFISAGGYWIPSKNCPNRIFSVQGFSRTSLRGVGVSGEWSSARGGAARHGHRSRNVRSDTLPPMDM
jgi:hypothetical protein